MAGIAERKVRDLARAITLVENGGPDGLELLRRLAERARSDAERPRSHVVGITGSPGVGKSTMTAALITAFRARGQSVAVVAVDPSSPFSGGALLGDRIRMQSHSSDENVFIRSMASRGHLGGLAAAAGHVLRVLDAAGFDVVVVETVGVGQSEVEVAAAADTTIVMLAPGMGDGIQAAKAGILEIGDLFVVNKADREGAQTTARDLRQMISLATSQTDDVVAAWTPPVLTAIASTDTGIDDIVAAIADHRAWALDHGELERRRLARAREEVIATALGMVRSRIEAASSMSAFEDSVSAVAHGEADVHGAAEALVDEMGSGTGS
jgi:LAO/AO transport system kinase